MLRKLFMLIMVACLTKSSNSYYTIVAPSSIQPDSTYSVAVFSNADAPVSVLLTIQNDKSFSISQSVTAPSQYSKTVDFAIGSLDDGIYKLIATGQNGLNFVNETELTVQTKRKSVFIQTDKAMYKPGDNIQFRVIVLDRNLNPVQYDNMDIYITDASNNRIEQWLGASVTMGVYIGELRLASTPVLGTWKISVNVDEESSEKEFEIAEYVLPKFEVTVIAPKDATYADGTLNINIKATYTYGENVKGVAQVTVSRSNSWDPTPQPTIVQKQVDIDGNAVAQLQIESDLKVSSQNWQDEFEITVAVTEALTGVVLEGSTTLTIRRNKFTVNNLNTDNTYEPSAPFTLSLQFAYPDGSPYLDSVNTIKVSYGSNYDKTDAVALGTGKIGANGVANINLNFPEIENPFYIFIQFLDYYDSVGYYQKAQPSTEPADENSLSVSLLTTNPKIGDSISIKVTSAVGVASVTYLLTARGVLISSVTQNVGNEKSVVITFQATFAMVPTAQFVVYYISSAGKIVAGSTAISVTGLNNFVTITTSDAEKQPGESVGITISTKPSSLVCLLGIDQSVALLKTGNDIKQDDAFSQLGMFSITGGGGGGGIFFPGPIFLGEPAIAAEPAIAEEPVNGARKKRSIWWGGSQYNFENAGLVLFTDTYVEQIYYPILRRGDGIMMLEKASAAVPMEATASAPNVQTEVRKYFPETWIWSCSDASSGSITRNEIAPDTITSWYLTGFATNNDFGLGITEDKTVFKVFKKFFVSLNLPYSVKRGEAVLIQIVVFNYLPKTITTKVTLDNSLKQFEFVDPDTQAYKDKGCPLPIDASRSKTVTVNSNDGVSLSFLITPLVVGPMIIKVVATAPDAGDAMEVPLLVEAEGVIQYKNKAQFVDLRSKKTFTADLTVDIPTDAVSDSTKIEVSAIGDVLGPALQNIDNLIQMPTGCGEQTMLGLAPDVVIYVYLNKTGLMTSPLNTKLLNFMKQGYQGELCYQHVDYSFSAFGNSDASGSSWLTAFVLRIFIQARPFITIDNNVIVNGLAWLAKQQQSDGRFNEPGNICHTDMQGEASKGVALTAYIVVTFLEDPASAELYAGVITNALNYIYQTLKELKDVYSLSIAAYAAQLADYEHKDELLQDLDALAKVQGDLKWWEKVQLTTPTDPWNSPPTVNVEITSYALLAYIKAGRSLDGLPIAKWIISQQGASGGFKSTQDTVVGITALAAFATEISGANVMSCVFKYPTSSSTISIDKTNSLLLQSVELPSTTKSVQVTCTGSGFSLVQLSYRYNLNDAEASPRFILNVDVDKSSNDVSLVLNICTSFIAGDDGDTTNMAIVEAELPSGFTADLETTRKALSAVKGFKKVETKKGNTVIVIYLDNLSTTTVCMQVSAYRLCQIADGKPVAVVCQDYYRSERRKSTFYSLIPKSICSLCDNDECKKACSKPSKDIQCPKKPIRQICEGSTNIFLFIEKWLREILARFC